MSADELANARSLASAASEELERRRLRALFAQRGQRGEDGVLRGGLMDFVRHFWHVLEPATDFVDGWAIWAIAEHLEAVSAGEITRLLINVPPGFMKSLLTNVFWPAWEWAALGRQSTRYVTFSYAATLTERDNGRFRALLVDPGFVDLYPGITLERYGDTKIANTATGWKFASSIEGVGTGERGDRVLFDDPHRASDSKFMIDKTTEWFRTAMLNRLNDQERSAIVVIMQRVHEADVSGIILARRMAFDHLMIPMEYDPGRHCETSIGWTDPRTGEGTLAWPERFPAESVAQLKHDMGPYAFCTPGESPVLMADLTMRPIRDVQAGDKVVGFTTGEDKGKRKTTLPVIVLRKSSFKAPVVKITLDSGEVIRCTPDHKWYMGKGGGRRGYRSDGTVDMRPLYREALIGRKLMRVCPSRLPEVNNVEERTIGWLAGFFDGEGSVTQGWRRDSLRPHSLITFTQTTGRNAGICAKLEGVLEELGFSYTSADVIPEKDKWEQRRHYWLKGPRLPLAQKFLHLVGPTKWRERLVEGAYGARFIIGQEVVVSIEPDGEEEVFGLETESGNYVVWGLASSNSAQYSQSPTPVGAGIIPRDSWQLWQSPTGVFPPVEFVVASLDGAFTEKEENDPSALTVWGVWTESVAGVKRKRIVLMRSWAKYLPFSGDRVLCARRPNEALSAWRWRTRAHWGLMEWVKDTCDEVGVDVLLVEAKGPGISAAQELRGRFGELTFSVQLINPKGDKVARALSVQPLFTQGVVYAPDKDWAEEVIDQCERFPKAAHDDLVDSTTQALRWIRDNGLAASDEEVAEQARRSVAHSRKPGAIYPC